MGGDKASCPKTLSTMEGKLCIWMHMVRLLNQICYIFAFPCLIAPSAVETHWNQQPIFEKNKLQVIEFKFDWSSHEPACL